MDVLSDVLGAVKLLGSVYFTTEFHPPWGLRVPPYRRVARFHLVLRGSFWVGLDDDSPPVELGLGDLVLVPHGAAHRMTDAPRTPCVEVDRVVEAAGFRGHGPLVIEGDATSSPTRLLCGHFEFDESIDHPLLHQLPSLLVIRRGEALDGNELDELVRFIAREIQADRAGQDAIVRRLSEVLFVQAVRAWARTGSPDQGLLAAVADPRIHRGLAAMHEEFGRAWDLDSLARTAGMSRTAFAETFRRLVGMTPVQYLTFWRMQRARELLARDTASAEAVALEVGYASLPAFSRTFKRWVGVGPGEYRRRTIRSG